ncbi:hypothetical protein ACFSO0_16605 [Brevibacillus sp. GCM10020057]|uniref:hypothetical protein n=1 Tax=Brevibacillus sp. GCM10020057 TaxID=3317327 RepID=UPI0036267FE1
MKWGLMISMTALAITMILFEWRRLSKLPKRDKVAFISLVIIAWGLSMFDLQQLPGPTTVLQAIFKPLERLLE